MANNQIALLAQAPVFETPFESQGKALQLRQLMNSGQLQDMEMQQRKQSLADEAAQRDIFARESDPQARLNALYKVNPRAAMALEKSQADIGKVKAETGHVTAQTQESQGKAISSRFATLRDQINTVNDPVAAAQWVTAAYKDPLTGPLVTAVHGDLNTALSSIPKDPAGFQQWKQQAGTNAEEYVKHTSVDANTAANNATSEANNKRTVNASYANAAAVRETANATRDAAKIQRDQATEMKLADDYRAQSKDFKAVGDAYRQINSTLDQATKSPAATLAAATKFMKLLDPGSVVRESELGMALAATGAIDRATNYFNTLQNGKVLTQSQVNDFKKITKEIYGAAQAGQKQIDANYKRQAETYKLRPEMVVQDLGQSAPQAATSTPAATKSGASVSNW